MVTKFGTHDELEARWFEFFFIQKVVVQGHTARKCPTTYVFCL